MEGSIGENRDNHISGNSSIDLKSGNVYHSQQVGPLTFSYSSIDSTNGPLGIAWTHGFNISIIPNSDGSLFLRQFDGRTIWFVPGIGNSYYADAKSRDTSSIVKNADGSYTRTTKFGKVYNFDGSGRLTGIVDRNGNATTLTYTGRDLTAITDPTGRKIVIGVSGGRIVSVTDFSGETSTISYSTAGLISSVADPLGNTWNFEYDSNNRMVQKTDPSNNVVSYTHNATTGMLASTTDPNNIAKSVAYDSTNGISTVTEKDGGVWTHQYYGGFNVPMAITDPYGNKTTYTYDNNNNLLSVTYPDRTSKSYTYDANRNVTSVKDPAGRTTTLTYNYQNRLTDILDPAGGTTHFTYDANGNLSSSKDPTGALTQIQRDAKGNITSVTDPLWHTVQYSYDQYNNIISVTDPTNVAVNLTRDASGNVLTSKDALNNTTTLFYDAAGQLTAAADPLGNTVGLTYDKNGNSNSITDPQQNLTTYAHDYRGRPTQKVDALGKITAFSYTATGCPSCGGGGQKLTSLIDAVGSTTSFAYDQRGLLTSTTDPLQKITSLTYDANGRPKTRTDRNGTALTYAYTATGNLSTITYPDQTQVTNTYDNLDRLTQLQDSLGTSSFSYDAAGRITSFTDPNNFTLSYTYDAAGNITQVTYPDNSTATYAYDAANRLVSVTNWLNEQASYAYDQDGRPATFTQFNGIATTYTYDAASRMTDIASSVASFQFTLDGNGNRIHSTESEPLPATPPAPGSTVYTYNTQKDRLITAGPLSYTYDNEGQLVNSAGAGLTFDYNHRLVAIGSDTQFSYDARGNRLTATRAEVTTRYIYDPWGNLIAEADSSNNITRKYFYGKGLLALATSSARYCYHFNGTGSTVAMTDMTGTVVNSYSYDPFGQILAQQEVITQPFKYVGQYGVIAEPNGLYYMRARYYDPSVGRFISEDPLGFGGGDVNLYAYVQNDPVNRIDPLGLYPGQYPPLPPGYDPATWKTSQWDNGLWNLKSPNGDIYTIHPEDPEHWRHWGIQDPNGKDKGDWPPNPGKRRPGQKKLKCNQSDTDPSENAPEWSPSDMPFMIMPINPMITPVPVDVPFLEPVFIFYRYKTQMKVNEKIRNRRIELGLTDVEVAKGAGISIHTYFAIELHDNEIYLYPTLQQVRRIAEVLKFDLLEMFELKCAFCDGDTPYIQSFSLPRNELIASRRMGMGISMEELGERVGFYESETKKLEESPEQLETWPIDFIKDLAAAIDVPIQVLIKARCNKCAK